MSRIARKASLSATVLVLAVASNAVVFDVPGTYSMSSAIALAVLYFGFHVIPLGIATSISLLRLSRLCTSWVYTLLAVMLVVASLIVYAPGPGRGVHLMHAVAVSLLFLALDELWRASAPKESRRA